MSFFMSCTLFPPTNLRWLFFDLNSFFASVEQQHDPKLRDRPVAVVPCLTNSSCVIAASYEAKAFGIKTGTNIGEARKLCPQLVCVTGQHDLYTRYHHKIMQSVGSVIPIDKVYSIDEAACRLLNNEQSLEQARRIAGDIKTALHDQVGAYVRCSIGIAGNVFLAKTASDMQKPDGLVILEAHNYRERLKALALKDLTGIGRSIEQRLMQAGIYSVEQLLALDPKHARKIWGSVAGEIFWYRLHGYDILDRPTQRRMFGHSRVLEPRHRNLTDAALITQNLLYKASTRLRQSGHYARKMYLGVRFIKNSSSLYSQEPRMNFNSYSWLRDISFSPSDDSIFFVKTLQALWAQMQDQMQGRRLLKVSIALYDLQEKRHVTPDLFARLPAQRRSKLENEQLNMAVGKIQQRYGRKSILYGSCPRTDGGFLGTKIAFTRIPERDEF